VHAVITLKLASRAQANGDANAQALVDEALRPAEQANVELRELAHGILPAALTRGGLRAGVDALPSRISLPVSVDVSVDRLPAVVKATAYPWRGRRQANIAASFGLHLPRRLCALAQVWFCRRIV
jgi:signal transduction histidine kinase